MENKKNNVSLPILIVTILITAVVTIVAYNFIMKTQNTEETNKIEETYTDNEIDNSEEKNTSNDETVDTKFNEGTYVYVNRNIQTIVSEDSKFSISTLKTYIKFYNNKFIIYNVADKTGTTFGEYEELNNNLIRCTINDDPFLEFEVVDSNRLKVTNCYAGDSETEFDIMFSNLFEKENECVMFNNNDLQGTWNISCVYKEMGGGEFWKTEEHNIDYTITFNNDGTYEGKEYRATFDGIYELEKNQIHLSSNTLGTEELYLIDNDTILYILGTEYKIILSRK